MMVSMMVSRQRRILFWLFIGKAGKKLSKEVYSSPSFDGASEGR